MELVKRPTTSFLSLIDHPSDLQKFSDSQLQGVVDELRHYVLCTIAKCGGHLASTLGVVELTVALHRIFNSPNEPIIWDVGHQAYAHKVLTGRRDQLSTIKKFKGLSPFCKRSESEHDPFGAGHSSTAISAGIGMAEAFRQAGREDWVVSVIGDNAMTAGLAFEGLNNAGALKNGKLLVVFNDNNMGIDPNVGALKAFCQKAIASPGYSLIRREVKSALQNLEGHGLPFLGVAAHKVRNLLKDFFTPGMMYEALGFRYVGPIDGHNLEEVLSALRNVKQSNEDRPTLLHVMTMKGKGYLPAEKDPLKYHGVNQFNVDDGSFPAKAKGNISYTDAFANAVVKVAKANKKVVGITAAMPSGTGLIKLQKEIPSQFYDVGIAEQHAVTFAAGLAAQENIRPICAIYSTFLQRAYDMIVHDVALQKLPVFFCLDRGGNVGADGPSHHGVFDYSYMRHIPHMVIMAPKDENELQHMVYTGVQYTDGPISVRYPRGNGLGVTMDAEFKALPIGKGEVVTPHTSQQTVDVTLVAIGNMVPLAMEAAKILKRDFSLETRVVNARFVKPLDEDLLSDVFHSSRHVITVEDHVIMGGFGSAVSEWAVRDSKRNAHKLTILGYPDEFIEHATPEQILALYGLDAPGIAGRVLHEAIGVSLETLMQAKLFDTNLIRLGQIYPKGPVAQAKASPKDQPADFNEVSAHHH